MNFKRKHYRSSTMKKCGICGSQRRLGKGTRKEHKIKRYEMLALEY